jgi:hypothetical protein
MAFDVERVGLELIAALGLAAALPMSGSALRRWRRTRMTAGASRSLFECAGVHAPGQAARGARAGFAGEGSRCSRSAWTRAARGRLGLSGANEIALGREKPWHSM